MVGYLPPELLQLQYLQILDLSNNQFSGNLPPQWSSQSLLFLDLSYNILSGPLPIAYGSQDTFPTLQTFALQGNLLTGALPIPGWTSTGFGTESLVTLRPGNDGLCGPVPVIDPNLYPRASPRNATPTAIASVLLSSGAVQSNNFSQTYIMYEGILSDTGAPLEGVSTTEVQVTNTLGSCATACGRTFSITSNLLDATWENNVSLADILAHNPGLLPSDAKPGLELALPCYPSGLEPSEYGSDAALLMFAGGNQQSQEGVLGAELAGAVVSPFGLGQNGLYYEGSWTIASNSSGIPELDRMLIQPVYWFVKMEASFKISAVTITAGKDISNVGLYIGDAAMNVFGNQLAYNGLNVSSGQTKTVPVPHVPGKLVILYAGYSGQGTLSLSQVKVWPAEGNAALNKAVNTLVRTPRGANLTTDGDLRTCTNFTSNVLDGVWAWVDLNYTADVEVVGLSLSGMDSPSPVQVFVSDVATREATASTQTSCGSIPAPSALPYEQSTVQCNLRGRYVGIHIPLITWARICEIEVFLTSAPTAHTSSATPGSTAGGAGAASPSHSDTVAIAVGAALGTFAVLLAILGTFLFVRSRRKARNIVPKVEKGTSDLGLLEVGGGKFGYLGKAQSSSNGVGNSSSGGGNGSGFGSGTATLETEVSLPISMLSGSSAGGGGGNGGGSGAGGGGGGGSGAGGAGQDTFTDSPEKKRRIAWFFPRLRKPRGDHVELHSEQGKVSGPGREVVTMEHQQGNGRQTPTIDTQVPGTDLSKFSNRCDVVDFRDIELVRTIGEGSFGLVWMAKYLQTTVAVKVLTHDMRQEMLLEGGTESYIKSRNVVVGSRSQTGVQPGKVGLMSPLYWNGAMAESKADGVAGPSQEALAALEREASIMASLRHPNCIQYLGACLQPPALIMEYCSRRSIDTILAAANQDVKLARQLDWVHLLSMASDAAKGMLYLHTRHPPIIHRDLKSPNLLVDALWHVKVSDFNLSRAIERDVVVSSLQITNPRWLAPEVVRGGQAGMAADVYSFGVVLWELMTWDLPWGHDTNPFSIINSIASGNTLPMPSIDSLKAGPLPCYDAYVALMQQCWAADPAARPSMNHVAQELRGMLTDMVQGKLTESSSSGKSLRSGDLGSSSSSGTRVRVLNTNTNTNSNTNKNT